MQDLRSTTHTRILIRQLVNSCKLPTIHYKVVSITKHLVKLGPTEQNGQLVDLLVWELCNFAERVVMLYILCMGIIMSAFENAMLYSIFL